MPNIKKITALETYPIRHAVLRKGKPLSDCQFDEDDLETTCHFGFFIDLELAGILSIYRKNNHIFAEENQLQIRGMAVLDQYQNKSLGKLLVQHCEKHYLNQSESLIWMNARAAAIPFYEKLGYTKTGAPFEIKNIGEHIVMFKKIKNE